MYKDVPGHGTGKVHHFLLHTEKKMSGEGGRVASPLEFLPLDCAHDDTETTTTVTRQQQQLEDLAYVKAGCEFELVVTTYTYTGMNRYHALTTSSEYVMGFHNATPQFRFVRRRNVVLSCGCRHDRRGGATTRGGACS